MERIVDRKHCKLRDGTEVLKYRIRWSGYNKAWDSWRTMDHLHEIAPLVVAYNNLQPLPEGYGEQLSRVAAPQPSQAPSKEASQRHHFRALSGGVSRDPPPSVSSEDLVMRFHPGARVRMLYRNDSDDLTWYTGTITRSSSTRDRQGRPDLSFSLQFDVEGRKVYGPYKLSCNSLELIPDAESSGS